MSIKNHPHLWDQDDRLGEDQSFGIAVIVTALSPAIRVDISSFGYKFFEDDTFRSSVSI